MKKFSLFPVLAFFLCMYFTASGQEYSYKHYGIREGLVGNHVYHAIKDNTGFLWFATETGVSRFDGTSFKNFTTAEGLPDNEILKLFTDSKGRVWMLPFKNTVCYYLKGKIYNAENDSMISALKLHSYVVNMFEDEAGNIFFSEMQCITVLTKDGKLIKCIRPEGARSQINSGGLNDKSNLVIHADSLSYELVLDGKGNFKFDVMDIGIKFWGFRTNFFYINQQVVVYLNNFKNMFQSQGIVLFDYKLKKSDTINPGADNSVSFLRDSMLFLNTHKGTTAYNFLSKSKTHYLENEDVSSVMYDNESNLWFTTLGRGIYRLSSTATRNVNFTDSQNVKKPVESIVMASGNIIAGSSVDDVFIFNKKSGNTNRVKLHHMFSSGAIVKIKKAGNEIYLLSERALQKADEDMKNIIGFPQTEISWSYKDFDIGKDKEIFFSTHEKLYSFSEKRDAAILEASSKNSLLKARSVQAVEHAYYDQRSTSVSYTDSGLYVGTLVGLKFVNWEKKITDIGITFPSLSKRITRLLNFNNKLWIGTNDRGVICFDGTKIIKNITDKNGLSGNLVRALYADSGYLWVGTDRGLNKLSLADTSFRVLRTYTTSDGLTSDMINAVYAEKDTVYVGTPEGLSFFPENEDGNNSVCDLQILDLTISGKTIPYDSSALTLKNKDNNIRFDFVAISYKSEGDITYYYRLSGIDTDWRTTKENYLQYPTLPSGNYNMELYAVNKFGVKSKTATISFEIEKKLVEKGWFIFLLILAAACAAWLLANRQIRRVKKVQVEKTVNAQKIAALEQQALKAQMNPHFIFNCLNSIQQYVIEKDVQGANAFISGFAKLIRQTLDNSGKESITVAEEERFLRTYLELEKSRFEEKFDYNIAISSNLKKDEVSLPPMLLQPYIENCIRHGIMHKADGKGIVDIHFDLTGNMLICSITDNGIGRHAAAEFRTRQHIIHQPKGTELTNQRILMINKSSKAGITLKIEDITDAQQLACGTRVTIMIPFVMK